MPQLRFFQQLSLLPVTVPEHILDFLDGLDREEVLNQESFSACLNPEYLTANRQRITQSLLQIKAGLGANIIGVQVEPYGKEAPNLYWCKLTGESGTSGIGFSLKSKAGTIMKVEFQETSFNEEELKTKLT
jgi:hypothetical protein